MPRRSRIRRWIGVATAAVVVAATLSVARYAEATDTFAIQIRIYNTGRPAYGAPSPDNGVYAGFDSSGPDRVGTHWKRPGWATNLCCGPLVNQATSRCLDVKDRSDSPGTRVVTARCDGSHYQIWLIEPAGRTSAVFIQNQGNFQWLLVPNSVPFESFQVGGGGPEANEAMQIVRAR